ncbi:cytochrome c-type biogenesis protein CcmH [Bibersteinia trehalosi USDA-ARS-USMARC-189]|uniref:Cytochrome c-type biogenesis protein n=1 Tax=Bibersteinia trehalosi USDA-ARS-USMARC-189 TaxID=1263831 RepID=A0ABM5PAZ3_BIBTR|nr:cytochrome c-type biogenesis protein [Bibersteinia trehalosi]AGH39434.1 cytochrome c-type biogenesis protein CcmH [Bibersteinia trehalosi USDA-ARS-USMARC-192]AHG82970.1 cytochrome c-type biogenesis protein CcmH [Bibersteinia trehalosi USDA-ARS-USMARC-189]
MKKTLILLCGLAPAVFAAPIEVQQFDTPQQESDYRALIQELRCPQCQNNNIADSNATIATDMRNKTLELLKQGKSKNEVVDYMIERYGNFVTYDPPLTPATIFLWVMPLALILLGFAVLFLRHKTAQQAGEIAEKNAKTLDQARLAEILKEKQ